MKRRKTFLSLLLCIVLIAAMALLATGCSGNNPAPSGTVPTGAPIRLGEGAQSFRFVVADLDGNEKHYDIHTDAETVGAALLELELIAGDESEFGLFIKTVDGIRADYDKDGAYWAFYMDGEYAMSGVDQTPITEGVTYMLKMEKS